MSFRRVLITRTAWFSIQDDENQQIENCSVWSPLLVGLLAVVYVILFPFLPPSPTAAARSSALRICTARGWP